MEALNYKAIKSKLKRRGLLFKKASPEDASCQFYALARQLDDHKLYAGLCHMAVRHCQATNRGQVGALLNAARSFSKAGYEFVSRDDYLKAVTWTYTEARSICDRSLLKSICLEMGRFYESEQLHHLAAECFKQSKSTSRCVHNLILSKRHKSALEELKNCPNHTLTWQDYTTMFLLELLLTEDLTKFNLSSLQQLSTTAENSQKRSSVPTDEHLFDLYCLLESLLISMQDQRLSARDKAKCLTDMKIKNSIVNKLSAFLDPAQIQLLYQIVEVPS